MEALIFFIIPLIIFIFFKILIWKDVDKIEVDTLKFKIGIDYYKNGNIEKCIEYFDAMVIQNPKSCVAFYYRGLANIQLKNVHSALFNFEKASNLSYELPDIYYQSALLYYELEEYEKALIKLNFLSRLYRNSHEEIYELRSKVYTKLNNPILAAVDKQKAENILKMS